MPNKFQREVTELNNILFEKWDPRDIQKKLSYDEETLRKLLKQRFKKSKPALLLKLFWYQWIRQGLYSVLIKKRVFGKTVRNKLYIHFLNEMPFPLLIFSRNGRPLPPSWLLKPFGRNMFRFQDIRDEWINYGNICLKEVNIWLKKNNQNQIMVKLIQSLQEDFGKCVSPDLKDHFEEIPIIKRIIVTPNKRMTNHLNKKR